MKQKKILLAAICVFIVTLIFGCNKNPSEPVENEDIVPQVDIPWPSLGDTPWPMYHHDPQSTGRSKYRGPQNGALDKKIQIGLSVSGISVGYNKTIFASSGGYAPFDFYAFNYDGVQKWKIPGIFCYASPIITSDSIVIVIGESGITAFAHSGQRLWQKDMSSLDRIVSVGFNMDKNGNLYYIDYDSKLTSLDKSGNIKWKLKDDRFLGTSHSAPSFSPDGNTLYVQGKNVSILAIDINSSTIKWIFGDKEQLSSPVIDNAGNIYIIPGKSKENGVRNLYSLNKEGKINWDYSFYASKLESNTTPTIDYKGNLYFGSDTLYSLTNNGNLRWKKYLGGGEVYTPLICDNENTIYVSTYNTNTALTKIIAVKENGSSKWDISDPEAKGLGTSPALTENEQLVYPPFVFGNGNILIIK